MLCAIFVVSMLCVAGARGGEDAKDVNKNEPAAAPGPITVTPMGKIQGSWMESRRGRKFEAYRGIRYAQPPVGELRFQPPAPIERYPSDVDASQEGPACPLPASEGYYVDEDCLRVNVYTPRKHGNTSGELLPVIFFIHAGGFYSMTGRSDLAGPHYLLDKDVVLVTINYRLASLGFLSTGDKLAPGNNGLKDQVMALRWVQRNIASFGGDPNSVTITGCSAGSISVMLHMISPMSKGLFHRAISMSGSPTSKVNSRTEMKDLAVKQAQLMNCPTESSQKILDCLKTKPWRAMGDSLLGFFEFGYDPIGIWLPNVEPDFGQERFLPIEPMDAIRQGKFHAVPYIISQTTDEFFWKAFSITKNSTLLESMNEKWDEIAPISFMLPKENSRPKVQKLKDFYLHGKQFKNDTETKKGLGQLYGDSVIGFPVHRLANLMCRHSPQPVWYYEWAYIGQHSHYVDPVTKKPLGAAHHDDLIYLFTLSYQFPAIGRDGSDARMVDYMTKMWYQFAKHGNPNGHHGDKWPAMKPDDRKYLHIENPEKTDIRSNMFEDRFKVWEELYPITY